MRSTMICLAAVAIAIRPDEHCRSIDMPAVVTGRPARSAAVRPIVVCTPCWSAAPMMQSSTSDGVDLRPLDRGADGEARRGWARGWR